MERGSLLRLVRRVGGLGLGFHACLILLSPEKERQTSLSERDRKREKKIDREKERSPMAVSQKTCGDKTTCYTKEMSRGQAEPQTVYLVFGPH